MNICICLKKKKRGEGVTGSQEQSKSRNPVGKAEGSAIFRTVTSVHAGGQNPRKAQIQTVGHKKDRNLWEERSRKEKQKQNNNDRKSCTAKGSCLSWPQLWKAGGKPLSMSTYWPALGYVWY